MNNLQVGALSSGTMSKLMRDSGLFLLYQCRDGWWIDKTQFHFRWFVEHCGQWSTWQDAWNDYASLVDRFRKSFACGYQGETTYRWRGAEYLIQHSFDPTYPSWNGQEVIDGGLARVGCVWQFSMSKGYPPDDVIAACIGYVPVTATFDKQPDPESILGYTIVNWQYVYHPDFGKPETADPVRPLPGHVYARAWQDHNRIDDWDREPAAKRLRKQLALA